MTEETKPRSPSASGDVSPSFPPDSGAWDDDDGGRTIATAAPVFDGAGNIRSPISAPPPAPFASTAVSAAPNARPPQARAGVSAPEKARPEAPKTKGKATLLGIMPDVARPAAPAKSLGSSGTLVSPQQSHGGSPASHGRISAPIALPSAASGDTPENDKDAATLALSFGDAHHMLGPQGDPRRDRVLESMRQRQDAHVVVGSDALGDDATLAIGPGQHPFAQMANAHRQSPARVPSSPAFAPVPPPPQPPVYAQGTSGTAPIPQWRPPATPPDPSLAVGPPNDVYAAPQGFNADAVAHVQPAPAPWGAGQAPMTFAAPPAMGHARPAGTPSTTVARPRGPQASQTVWLAVVGAICLTIFIVGLVLFLTTPF